MGGPFGLIKNPQVPIVGQPFTLKNYFVTVQIVCNCVGKEPVLLAAHTPGQCPACHRVFQLQGLKPDPTGQLQFVIGIVQQQPSAAAEGQES